jgi:ABC-type transport system involved in cytochrome bd biosynthesis fused ATPase/permease subunit
MNTNSNKENKKINEILKLENISLSFDNKKTYILNDISFSVFS